MLTILSILLSPAIAHSLTVTVDHSWKGIFTGIMVPFDITVIGEPNSTAIVSWKLVSKGRTLSRNEHSVSLSRSGTVTTSLPLQPPSLKSGINIDARLVIDVTGAAVEGRSTETTHYEFKIDLFGSGIFLEKQHFYQELNIFLFDPIGKTADVFDILKIPYSILSTSQLLNQSNKGLVIIGEGVALDEHRNLSSVLIDRARNGHKILVLQPLSGSIPLSEGIADKRSGVSEMLFSDTSIIQLIAKNHHWVADESSQRHGIVLSSDRRAVLVQINESRQGGWDWFYMNFKQTGGQFIVCMLPFIDQLSNEPIKQIILGRLLAYAGGKASVDKVFLLKE